MESSHHLSSPVALAPSVSCEAPSRLSPLNESLRQISETSWLLCDDLQLDIYTHQPPAPQVSWSDGRGSYYAICHAPTPRPQCGPLSPESQIKKVYDIGDMTAVWSMGDAFFKAHAVQFEVATREHVTLEWVAKKKPSFCIPKVLYQAEHSGRHFMILSRVVGQTLQDAWTEMDDATKLYYSQRYVQICVEMSMWKGSSLAGVDGGCIVDHYLTALCDEGSDFRSQSLIRTCKALGMKCDEFVFFHCDLVPLNTIVDLSTREMGIIDWENAGFVPEEWILTKTVNARAMELEWVPNRSQEENRGWVDLVVPALREAGFPDVLQQYESWSTADRAEYNRRWELARQTPDLLADLARQAREAAAAKC